MDSESLEPLKKAIEQAKMDDVKAQAVKNPYNDSASAKIPPSAGYGGAAYGPSSQYVPMPSTSECYCPRCGYCPHCGRGGYGQSWPFYPPYPKYYLNGNGVIGGQMPSHTYGGGNSM